jgi:hypothetical protein
MRPGGRPLLATINCIPTGDVVKYVRAVNGIVPIGMGAFVYTETFDTGSNSTVSANEKFRATLELICGVVWRVARTVTA